MLRTVPRRFVTANARPVVIGVVVVWVAAAIDLVAWSGDNELRGGGDVPFIIVPIVTVVVYPALLWRERAPVVVFGIFWLHALSGFALPRYLPIAALLVALHAVAAHRPPRISAVLALSCLGPFLLDAVNAADHTVNGGAVAIVTALWILGVLATCAWSLGRRSYLAAWHREADRRAHEAAVADTIRSERLSLARDLHDTIANAVNAMVLHAAGARTIPDGPPASLAGALATIERTGVVAMEELRRLLLVLRETDGAGTSHASGLRDVGGLVADARRAGQSVKAEIEARSPALDRKVDVVAFRIVQEGLANAAKHAPGAEVDVTVRTAREGDPAPGRPDADLLISVASSLPDRPSPRRPDAPSTGLGLIGLAERVDLVGGRMHAGGTDDGRFLLEARLPARPGHPTVISETSYSDVTGDAPRARRPGLAV